MQKQDFESIRRLFDEQYDEYLGFLQLNDPQRYDIEKRERQEVDRTSFEFFLNTGSSFVAEEKHEVIGYVISQTMSDVHGMNDVLLVEEIAVKAKYRRKGIATALFQKIIDYAKRHNVKQIHTAINPDNDASIKLAQRVGFNVEDWKKAVLNLE
jgi:L-amino acid N-acyltransferase YncA